MRISDNSRLIVRKDLVRKFKGQYPVPTYVAEFLLGRYCATTDEAEIAEGLRMGVDGVETFVATPELQNPEGIGTELAPCQCVFPS